MRLILANCPSCEEVNAPLGQLSKTSASFRCRSCGDTWSQKLTGEQLGGDVVMVRPKLTRSPASKALGRLLMDRK